MGHRAHEGLETAAWGGLSLLVAVGWFATARGLAFRWGLGEAAGGIGVATAATLVVVLWSWRSRDRQLEALAGGACPRCGGAIASQHEHGQRGRRGIEWWECASCGYARSESLTCERCAA
jgi:ribosomal protein S27AE